MNILRKNSSAVRAAAALCLLIATPYLLTAATGFQQVQVDSAHKPTVPFSLASTNIIDTLDPARLPATAVQTSGNFTLAGTITFTSAPAFLNASQTRTSLGLGSMSTQSGSYVSITGGVIQGLTTLDVSGSVTGITPAKIGAAASTDPRFPATVTGVRMGNGASADTAAVLGIDYGHGYASRSKGDVLRVLTAADLRALSVPGTVALTSAQTVIPSGVKDIDYDGDSVTAGLQASSGQGTVTGTVYPAVATAALGTGWTGHNDGVSGNTIEQRTAAAATAVDVHYSSSNARNVLAFLCGTNNLYGSGPDSGVGGAASAFGKLQTYVAARAAVGWDVYIGTVPPFQMTGQAELNRLEYNARIRAVYGDHVLDFAATAMGAANTSTYYGSDNSHPNDTGYALMGNTAATRIQPTAGASAPPTYGARVSLLGVASGTDGGAVELFYDPGLFTADDGASIFRPSAIASTGAGRWRKVGTSGTSSGGGTAPTVYTWDGTGTYTVPDDADALVLTGDYNTGTLTLPAAGGKAVGTVFQILSRQQFPFDYNANTALTVTAKSGDNIYGFGSLNPITTFTIGGNGTVPLTRATGTRWDGPQMAMDAVGINFGYGQLRGGSGNGNFISWTNNNINFYAQTGYIVPRFDDGQSLGSASQRFKTLALSRTATISETSSAPATVSGAATLWVSSTDHKLHVVDSTGTDHALW